VKKSYTTIEPPSVDVTYVPYPDMQVLGPLDPERLKKTLNFTALQFLPTYYL
jgi:hypothetical protein